METTADRIRMQTPNLARALAESISGSRDERPGSHAHHRRLIAAHLRLSYTNPLFYRDSLNHFHDYRKNR